MVEKSCRQLHEVLTCSGLVVRGLFVCCHVALPTCSVLWNITIVIDMNIPCVLECTIKQMESFGLPVKILFCEGISCFVFLSVSNHLKVTA